jgi:hypothetical protein
MERYPRVGQIAAMTDAYKVNVAPHNFSGHLGSGV